MVNNYFWELRLRMWTNGAGQTFSFVILNLVVISQYFSQRILSLIQHSKQGKDFRKVGELALMSGKLNYCNVGKIAGISFLGKHIDFYDCCRNLLHTNDVKSHIF